MHDVDISPKIVERVLARRGRYHIFDDLDPTETALIIIDMQPTFVAPGGPAEVPKSRGIVDPINGLADELRPMGVTVIWVTHAVGHNSVGSDWDMFYNNFVSDEVRAKTIESLDPGAAGQQIWDGFRVADDDLHIVKNRYSALIPGSSQLERVLHSRGLRNLLITGTKTNVCCEATGRDAMMMDFRVVMVSDCLAALSDGEHQASLETFIQQFGDVMNAEEVLSVLRRRTNPAA
tara:strand:- start:1334 stop:2035 length:702 start_codon:yes stop_codon:yes gene_type:complete